MSAQVRLDVRGNSGAAALPSSFTRPERPVLLDAVAELWQQAIGFDAVVPASAVTGLVDGLLGTSEPVEASGLLYAWIGWIDLLDHRCEHPEVVAAAVLDCADTLALEDTAGWRHATPSGPVAATADAAAKLRAEVHAHRDEPHPDAVVLSDSLLHFVGDVDDSGRLAVQLDYLEAALDAVLPPSRVMETTDSIYYTPEARARLEARAQLNLARRRAVARRC